MARRFTDADLVWAPVQSPAQLMEDPQAQAAGCFVETPDGKGGFIPAPAVPVRFPGADDGPKGPALPGLGRVYGRSAGRAGVSARTRSSRDAGQRVRAG